ncbi:hypothetical protein CSHISOI_09160, partial [Colletotrichum shisoi]
GGGGGGGGGGGAACPAPACPPPTCPAPDCPKNAAFKQREDDIAGCGSRTPTFRGDGSLRRCI